MGEPKWKDATVRFELTPASAPSAFDSLDVYVFYSETGDFEAVKIVTPHGVCQLSRDEYNKLVKTLDTYHRIFITMKANA